MTEILAFYLGGALVVGLSCHEDGEAFPDIVLSMFGWPVSVVLHFLNKGRS